MNILSAAGTAVAPYRLYLEIAAVVAVLAGVGMWNLHEQHIGAARCDATNEVRLNKSLVLANAEIVRLNGVERAKEQLHNRAVLKISTDYEGELKNAETKRVSDVAAARSGALKLYDPGRANTTCIRPASNTAPSTSERDGETGGELSPEFTEFLYSEANRADSLVGQLTACQSVVVSDRAQP